MENHSLESHIYEGFRCISKSMYDWAMAAPSVKKDWQQVWQESFACNCQLFFVIVKLVKEREMRDTVDWVAATATRISFKRKTRFALNCVFIFIWSVGDPFERNCLVRPGYVFIIRPRSVARRPICLWFGRAIKLNKVEITKSKGTLSRIPMIGKQGEHD